MKAFFVLAGALLSLLPATGLAATPTAPAALAAALQKSTECEVYSQKAKRTFPCSLKINSFDPKTGAFVGQLTWPTLNSVHRIEGKIANDTLTFTETAYIKKGSAHLNCSYTIKQKGNTLSGTWQEPGKDQGTITISLASTANNPEPVPAKPSAQSTLPKPTANPNLEALATALKKPVAFEVYSSTKKKNYLLTIEIEKINVAGGTFVGRLNWPDFKSINRIEGKLAGDTLTFTETAYIQKGGAHLNCIYTLRKKGATYAGTWEEPGKETGTAEFSLDPKKNEAAVPAKAPATTKPTPPSTKATTPATATKSTAPAKPATAAKPPADGAPKPAAAAQPSPTATAAASLLAVPALKPQAKVDLPPGTKGYYKLVEIDFARIALDHARISYGSKSTCSSFTADFRFEPIKDAPGPFAWSTSTSWSVPEILVPGQSHTFQLAGSSTRDHFSATIDFGRGNAHNWTIAAVRHGLTSSLNGPAVPDVNFSEFKVTLPKEIANWRDRRARQLPANIRMPATELGIVAERSASSNVSPKMPSDIPVVETKLSVSDWMYGEGSLQKIQVYVSNSALYNRHLLARYVYEWQDVSAGRGPFGEVAAPEETAEAALTLAPDRFDCRLGTGQTLQVKVAVTGGNAKTPWKFGAAYERNARPFATFALKTTDATHAVLDLKEAGLKPERGDDNAEYATLLVTADQPGRATLQAKLTVRLVQEGVFLADTNRNPQTGAFTVHADGKKTATEIDYRVYALNSKTQLVANLVTDAATRKKIVVECLEKPSSEAARLAASGQLQVDATRLRQLNDPAGTARLSFARELPSDGRVVPARFRLRYTERREETFSAPFTLAIATTANGPGSPDWKVEVERCATVINKFVPLTYRPRLQAMLDKRKQTLGAGGVFLLRQKIWSAATHLVLAEGGQGYAKEADWAATIESTLEWTKWAGDFAFDAAAGVLTNSPYGALAAGQLKEIILSAIEAYQDGKDASTWAWEYLATIPALVEGQVFNMDRFEKWAKENKVKTWAIFLGYNFLSALTKGSSITEAVEETVSAARDEIFSGWLGDMVEKHGHRNVRDLVPSRTRS